MLLTRVTEHVRTQNWLAVAIDFVIVVVGVLFALVAEQWFRDQQLRKELTQIEVALNASLLQNLFNMREVVAMAPCRKERTEALSLLLQSDSDPWRGLPWTANQGIFETGLPEVLPTPYRMWGSHVWNAEQSGEAIGLMDADRRRALDTIFTGTNLIRLKQDEIFEAMSKLKVLAIARDISASDRTRYLERLHYHELQSGLLERVARQTLEQIEVIGYSADDTYIDEFQTYMETYADNRIERYGNCFVPFELPFLSAEPPGRPAT
ncbi:hypothetical protein R0137_02430 [Congregibacter brevis]|uniref:Uncharacterized protein n=1 Tax=Congregibacter brevis TaxID=3081201 RepID=A0ABZ0IF36_9GAMM|nr:hypothetical protein R0137_02430 [Congregibacter sp. IMCC45268]